MKKKIQDDTINSLLKSVAVKESGHWTVCGRHGGGGARLLKKPQTSGTKIALPYLNGRRDSVSSSAAVI